MAVVLPMAAAHHPSLRPRRLSTPTTWTAAGAPTTNNGERQSVHPRPFPPTTMKPSPSRGRSRSRSPSSGPSADGTPSSPSSRASESPNMGVRHHEDNSRSGDLVLHHTTNGSGSTSANVSVLGSVSVPAHRTRRPRRRADEVERLYKCTWNGCEKSYGTLSHLNDHVRLQRHGNKREPHEFKEARRIWRQERKSRRLREHAHAMQAASSTSTAAAAAAAAAAASVTALAPASISHPTTTTAATTSPTFRLISSSNQDVDLALDDDDSSREDNEELDFDRSHTPVTQVNVGPRIAAASDYHTQSSYSDYFINQSQYHNYSHRTLSTPASLHPMQMQMHQQDHHILSPRPSQLPLAMSGPDKQQQPSSFRLPSIAELRLDLTLDEYEAHTALGSLSSAATSLARPSTAGPLSAMSMSMSMDGSPSRAIRHHRRRDSWGSPSTSSNASIAHHKYAGPALAPPPPFHLYHSHNGNGNDPATNPTHSPDITNHYRFRVSSVSSATTSPSIDRSNSRTLAHPHSQYPPYSRSHSRTLSSSRPSTSATSTTTTQPASSAYPHSTPSHPPSSFPFIPAPPPRVTPEASEGEPRRKRRKYEEIERRYLCGWQGCSKAYGTLNHLNDHVSLQGHGPKRRSSVLNPEFA